MNQEAQHGTGALPATAARSIQATRAPTVIAPLDGSVQAIAALSTAKVLAQLERATLHLVHVGERLLPADELLQVLGLAREHVRGSVIAQADGAPAASIVRLASEWQSPLIVMCTHTNPARPASELGSVAEAVLREAPCPVVLVRPELGLGPRALRRILVPHDGRPTTAAALQPAVDLVERSGAELDILHVATADTGRSVEPGTLTAPRYLDQPQHEWPVWTREFLDRLRHLCHCPPTVQTRLFLRTGEPGAEIVRFARERESDLIVVAWRGHLEGQRAATLRAVVRDATCPALVLRMAS
jgi:nucleotide-binding universal stress UspA family protein